MPDKTGAGTEKTLRDRPLQTRLGVHARVVAVAIVFGLGAYAVVQGLIALTRSLGWLDWMHP